MNKSKLILLVLVLLYLLNFIFAQLKIENEANIDEKILAELKTKDEVSVIIKLKDYHENTGISSAKENYDDWLKQEKSMVHAQQEKFLEHAGLKGKIIQSSQEQNSWIKIEKRYSAINSIAAKITPNAIYKLKNNPVVDKIYYDEIRYISLDTSVPQINATGVYGLIYNSTNITGKYETVCVIDTGIDYGNPNLANCTNSTFIAGNCSRIIGGYDPVNNDDDPADDHGHGTHVAGIIISNDTTYRGVAPDANIVVLKACDSGGSCSTQDVADSVDWCINNRTRYNISVISMSLGGGSNTANCDGTSADVDAANKAANLGFFVAIAAGNAGSTNAIASPACASNVTAVGGIETDDATLVYNRAPFMSILAPATSVSSTVPKSGGTHSSSTGFKSLSGTSMATPHVAGAGALIKQYRRLEQGRNLTFQQIEDALNSTGKNITESGTVYKRINVYRALLSLDNTSPALNFTFPTPTNATNTTNLSIFVNITSNEVLSSAILEINNTNTTMNGSVLNWFFNKTGLSNGVFTYRVFGNDSAGNMGFSETRTIQINNTAPNITSTFPNYTLVNITEPNNQTFNITYNDAENDIITITWYQNSSVVSASNNYTFLGNYSGAGIYNITVTLSDGVLESRQEWTLTINNTNRIPSVVNITITSTDNRNLTNGTLIGNWSYTDSDGDNITTNETAWFNNTVFIGNLTNLTSVSAENTTKSQNWTFSVRVFDGLNWSNWANATLTILNAPPDLVFINNITANETDWINISVNASDIDGDVLNYTINFSRFTQAISNFSWQTNTSDSGNYVINIVVNDSSETVSQNITITIIDMVDSDNDGIIDSKDDDDDNDNINDTGDFLTGNASVINSSTPLSLNITINLTTNLSKIFNGTLLVNISNNTKPILEFNWTFNDTNRLNLYNLTINRQSDNSTGWIEVKGLSLNGLTKTAYIDNLNSSYTSVCIKDIPNASVNNISARCNGANETVLQCDGTTRSGYTCTDLGYTYRIVGLNHSALIERCKDNDGDGYGTGCAKGSDCDDNDASKNTDCSSPQSDSGGGSSGGGGGGGGGGAGGTKPSNSVTYFYNLISKDEAKSTNIKKDFIAIKKVSFIANSQISRAELTFSLKNELPIGIIPPINKAYQYIEVSKENIEDKDISSLEIEFSVNTSWLADNNYDEKSVKLQRAPDIEFTELPTEFILINESSAYYRAESSGFSIFAITAKEKVKPVEQKPVQKTELKKNQSRLEERLPIQKADNESINISSVEELEKPTKKGIFEITAKPRFVITTILVLSIIIFLLVNNIRKRLKRENLE